MIKTSSMRLCVAGFGLALLAACSDTGKAPTPAAPPPPAVTVAKPQIRQVVDEDEYVGRFVALNAVEIRARVSGYLEQVHFKDGAISGYWAIGSRKNATAPRIMIKIEITPEKIGRSMKKREICMALSLSAQVWVFAHSPLRLA